jgi:outer membrane protein assembly factor BamB
VNDTPKTPFWQDIDGHTWRWLRRHPVQGILAAGLVVLLIWNIGWVWQRVVLLVDPGQGLPVGDELSGEVAWQADWPSDDELDVQQVGAWLDDGVLVWGGYHRLTGYDAATGEELWLLEPPEDGFFCAMSRETSGGRGVVMATRSMEIDGEENTDCGQAMLVETADGTELWQTEIEPNSLWDNTQPEPTADAVLVPGRGGVHGLDPDDGQELWHSGEWLEDDAEQRCTVEAAPAPDGAVLYGSCWNEAGDSWESSVAALDTGDGELQWQRTIEPWNDDPWPGDYYLAAGEPLTLLASFGEEDSSALVFGASGEAVGQVPAAGPAGEYTVDSRHSASTVAERADDDLEGRWAVGRPGSLALIHDGTVYAPADTGDWEDDRYGIAAVDLATGEEAWSQHLPAERETVPVAVEGDRLIAVGYHKGFSEDHTTFEVLAFDLGDGGEPTLLGPGVDVPDLDRAVVEPFWQDGRMYLLPYGEGGRNPGGGAVTVLE